MLERKQEFYTKLQQLADSVLLAIAFWASWAFRDRSPIASWMGSGIPDLDQFYWQMLVIVPFTPIVLDRMGFYSHPLDKSPFKTWGQLTKAMLVMVAITALISTFNRQHTASRAVLLIFPFVAIPFLVLREAASRWWLRRHWRALGKERVIFAGPPQDVDRLLSSLPETQVARMDIVSRIDISTTPLADFVAAIHAHSVGRVIFAAAHVHLNKIEEAVAACELEGVEAWLWTGFIQTSIARPSFDALGGKPMLVFRCTPEVSWALLIKALMDRSGALIAIILASPIMLITYLGIKMSSPGPVIFTQMRSGRHGRPFKMFKFRSMGTDAEQKRQELLALNQMTGPVFKVDNDPRIFPFGKIIRRWSIDELPQLFNVLNGDMSLVGPRPLPVYEVENFSDTAHRRRLSMKPGLTCLWQVSGRNNITGFDQWVELDLKYIDNWSLILDITILLRTIPAVFRGAGAK